MKCSHCEKEVPDSAKVCGYCGTKLEKKRKHTCPDCGKSVPAKAKVCGHCGVKLAQQAAETPKPAPQKAVREPSAPAGGGQAAEKKKLPKWALPAGLGVLALALVLFFVMKSPSQPETVREEPQQEEAQADADILDFLTGTWSGDAVNNGDVFEITLRFDQGCQLSKVCGYFDIPVLDCSGDVAIISAPENRFAAGNKYNFRVSSLSSGCGGKATEEWLRYINSKELEYYSRGDYGISQGTLYKQ